MRKIFVAFLGAMFGLAIFAFQTKAQSVQQMPVICGEYKALADALKKIDEEIVGRGSNAMGVVDFWLNPKKGTGTVVLRVDMDKACVVLDVEDFKQMTPGEDT